MRIKLTHAPAYFALAQVRFNQIGALDQYIPDIQDKFRLKGFADQKKQEISTFHLNPSVSQPMTSDTQVLYTAWNMDQTAGFILNKESLTFQTTAYDTFENFSEHFYSGLNIIHEAMTLQFIERVGLRYLNAIYPSKNKGIEYYVKPSVLGMYNKLTGKMIQNFSETVYQNGKIQLISRAILREGNVGFPPDLQVSGIKVLDRFVDKSGLNVMLDIDSSWIERSTFDADDIIKKLELSKKEAFNSFNQTVTQNALDKWR